MVNILVSLFFTDDRWYPVVSIMAVVGGQSDQTYVLLIKALRIGSALKTQLSTRLKFTMTP